MALRRRSVLALLGLGAAGVVGARPRGQTAAAADSALPAPQAWPFKPVPTPLPVDSDGLTAAQQQQVYRRIAVEDRLVVPEGYRADLIAAWGDPMPQGRFGFNNDYLGFVSRGPDEALLTVNFEYISALPWTEGFREVVGRPLPWTQLVAALASRDGVIDCTALQGNQRLLALIRSVSDEAMADLGLGVIAISRNGDGQWVRRGDPVERRVDGLAGLADPSQRLQSTGPAAAVFRRAERMGYDDGLGDQVIGTFANCAGGTTPWGTVLSAEENFQSQVPEPVYADGSAVSPSERPFVCRQTRLGGLGNVYGLHKLSPLRGCRG